MIERSTYVDAIGSLLFEFDTDSGSMTDYLASRGVHFDSMVDVLDAVAAAQCTASERRTSRDEGGVAFEYADDRYRPDIVAFSIVNARTIKQRA